MADTDVAIVGAGVAGLAAARLLARHGYQSMLFEAADFIGGRVRTLRKGGWEIPIELGAEFVHGRPAPTLSLGGGAIELVPVPEQRVMLRGGAAPLPMHDTWRRFARAMAGARHADPTESVQSYLSRAPLSKDERELVVQIVEGYHAAPLADVSALAIARDAENSGSEFKQYRTSRGYDSVLAALEQDLAHAQVRLKLKSRVRRIKWKRGHVELLVQGAHDQATLHARACLVTASIGVLQAPPAQGGIEIKPRPVVLEALTGLGMGAALRVVMRFEHAPWIAPVDEREVEFLHVPEAPFQTLWREARAGQAQITAWAGGRRARELSALSQEAVGIAALQSLSRATGLSEGACRARLIDAQWHDFNRDPLCRGAYSYVRAGGDGAAKRLGTPVDDTLFFAGEALDSEYPGTVAGALGSGETAARRIVRACQR